MKHYVLGFLFNDSGSTVLLVEKKEPEWQNREFFSRWNGIGGKIEDDDINPLEAMQREAIEEIARKIDWYHKITLICPGGTVFVFAAWETEPDPGKIYYEQMEDELLRVWFVDTLPDEWMSDLKWMIPVCLSSLQFPLIVQQNTLGVSSSIKGPVDRDGKKIPINEMRS